jgi:CubicO group peptidase (beta-lactamase class C family)
MNMVRLIIAALALAVGLALILPNGSLVFDRSPPASAALDTKAFDALLSRSISADKPGVNIVISRQGEVIYQASRGLADVNGKRALVDHDVLLIGSITKQYAAAAVLKLAAEDQLALADSVGALLADERFNDVTVAQLLNHTSGIASYTSIPGYMVDERITRDLTTEQLIEVFAELPRDFAPGQRWAYNNSGYVLVGAVIEAVTDMPWHAYIEQALLQPLQLHATGYYSDANSKPYPIQGYSGGDAITPALPMSITQPHAAGALAATAVDVDRWQYALHSGKVLPAAWYTQMVTPTEVMPNYGFGLGLGSFLGQTVREHSGGIHGFVSDGIWLEESQLSVVVLANSDTPQVAPTMLTKRLAALALGTPLPIDWPVQPIAADMMQQLHGSYQIDADTQRYLIHRDGELLSQRQGGAESKAIYVGNETFALADSLAYFSVQRNADGSVKGVNFYQAGAVTPGYADKVSDEVSVRTVIQLTEQQALRLTGDYELQPGFIIQVRLTPAGLTAQATGQSAFALTAASEYEVYNSQFGITLLFDAADEVPAQLTLLQGGARMPAPRVDN